MTDINLVLLEIAIRVGRDAIRNGDTSLSAFAVRDFKQVKELGLDDLAWAYYQNGCTAKEANELLDMIENSLGLI